jgi:probable rRNA maturation factor
VLGDLGVAKNAELCVSFVEEHAIATLNERFMHHEGPTDVLSFPIEDDPLSANNQASKPAGLKTSDEDNSAPLMLGDVVICPSLASHNASTREVGFDDEIALLVVHGILHLVGMDHEGDEEAEIMEDKERRLLAAHHVWPNKATK